MSVQSTVPDTENSSPTHEGVWTALPRNGRFRQIFMKSTRRIDALAIIAPIAVVVVWQAIVSFNLIDSEYLPAPLEVAEATWAWLFGSDSAQPLYDGTWLEHAIASSQRVIYGFALGGLGGVLVGCIIGWSDIGRRMLDPLFQILRPIPITAWLPFMVVFFGTGAISAIALIAVGAFFPIMLNTVDGLRHVPELQLRAAQMLGCVGRFRLLLRVGLPSALPSIFTGLRLSIGLSWVLVIVAEMIAVRSGFGYVMWDAYYFIRLDIIVAAMLSVGLMGFLFDRIAVFLERHLCSWATQ